MMKKEVRMMNGRKLIIVSRVDSFALFAVEIAVELEASLAESCVEEEVLLVLTKKLFDRGTDGEEEGRI
jgi:hypothetical protein